MTQIFNENVKVVGSSDTPQLDVQGSSSQTQALQRWLGAEGNTLARLTNDGRLEIGNNLGAGAPQDALVQANQDVTLTSSSVASGQHSLGRVTISSPLSRIVDWVFHELHLLGSAALSGVQTALRVKLIQDNTGDPANLEVRAVEGQVLNQRGSSGSRLRQATGVRGTASNAGNAYATKVIGVEAGIVNDTDGNITEATAFEVAAPVNNGTIGTLYGVRIPDLTVGEANISLETGEGIVRLGDHTEMKFHTASPAGDPPAGFLKLYLKPTHGWLRLYAKDPSGIEYELADGASSFRVDGPNDAVLSVNSNSQTYTPMILLQKGSKPYWSVYCDSIADGSGNSGGEFAIGRFANDGSWLGGTISIARNSGFVWLHQGLVLNSGSILQIQPNAGVGKVLTSDSGGNATWQTPVTTEIAPICQGRLTLISDTPLPTDNVTAATTLYFTPFRGTHVSLFNGTVWETLPFSERSLSLSGLSANTNFDIFIYNNGGTLTLEAVAWADATTRATAIALQDGIYVKSGVETRRYLGTIRTTGTTGQCEDSVTKRFVYNEYHPTPKPLKVTEATYSWSYTTNAWRAANNSTSNRVEMVIGNSGPLVALNLLVRIGASAPGVVHGIGYDVTNANHANVFPSITNDGNVSAYVQHFPTIGHHYYQWVENGRGVSSATMFGYAADAFQSGLIGQMMM